MQRVFDELRSVYPYPDNDFRAEYGNIRKCDGGCKRWIRFCTPEWTTCGPCNDDRRQLLEDIEDHKYGMKRLMDELLNKNNKG